jgi:hypothetical protein
LNTLSLLNPTPDELHARQQKRLRDLAERAKRNKQRRRRLVRLMAIAGALVFSLTCFLAELLGCFSIWGLGFFAGILGGWLRHTHEVLVVSVDNCRRGVRHDQRLFRQ